MSAFLIVFVGKKYYELCAILKSMPLAIEYEKKLTKTGQKWHQTFSTSSLQHDLGDVICFA
jgi:hypothetical protein